MNAAQLTPLSAVLLDMDGVLYRGQAPLPQAREFLDVLDQHTLPYACVTNNASMTPTQYEAKLAAMGFHIPAARVITSAVVTNHWLRSQYPHGTTIYAIGMVGLLAPLFGDGYFRFSDHRPQLVVQGADFELTYNKLRLATLAIRAGARFIATNPDTTFPTEEGLIPGAGAVQALLTAATGVVPEVLGKPSPVMLRTALELLHSPPGTSLMVGDRLDTDIAAGLALGMRTALVLTGVTQPDDLEASSIRPDYVVADLHELRALIVID